MIAALVKKIPHKEAPKQRCLSCGTIKNMGRRKYCSLECRRKLRQKLNMRTGLLRALNTRYATFYFTDTMIVLDILTYESSTLFSFIYPRLRGFTPADDFCHMANTLGNTWWAEKKRTHKRYLASRYLLEKATKNHLPCDSVKPVLVRRPSQVTRSITSLQMDPDDLDSPKIHQKIKTAYRRQAKKHHPDSGGDATFFRKIHHAYQELIRWASRPTFISRRGFPDKWFYAGDVDRWVQPTLHRLK
jgi:hypothetical protein